MVPALGIGAQGKDAALPCRHFVRDSSQVDEQLKDSEPILSVMDCTLQIDCRSVMFLANSRTVHMICFNHKSNCMESVVPMSEQFIHDTTSS